VSKAWKEYNKLPQSIEAELSPLNDLSGSAWARASKSVKIFEGAIAQKRRVHGAAFPISLARDVISIYSKAGDTVLDPFVGVGTTTDAAQLLGRNGVGFDTNSRFIALAKKGVETVDRTQTDHEGKVEIRLFAESCERIGRRVHKNSIDLVLTSPPYCHLLNVTTGNFGGSTYGKNIYRGRGRKLAKPYSASDADYGNLDWERYAKAISNLMVALYRVCKPGSFNVWVVRDFRDMEKGVPYVNLHGKIIETAESAGWVLTDLLVWDQTRQRPLVKLGGQKKRRFYLNIGHSFIVIFRKNVVGERFRNVE
jgi:DNA modification methylase